MTIHSRLSALAALVRAPQPPARDYVSRQQAGVRKLIEIAERQAAARDTLPMPSLPKDIGLYCADQLARWDAEQKAGKVPASARSRRAA